MYIFTHHIDSSETPVSAFHPGGLFAKTFPKAPSAEKRMVKEHRIDGRKLRGGQAFGDAKRCDKPPIIGPCLDRVHPPYCLPAFQGEPFPSTHVLMVVNLRMPWTPPVEKNLLMLILPYHFMANNKNRLMFSIFFSGMKLIDLKQEQKTSSETPPPTT